jgi:biotin operon repressor
MALTLGYKSEPEMLHAMYAEKVMSTEEIGERLGYTGRAIAWRLRRHGFTVRSRGGYHRYSPERIRRMGV